MNAFLRDRALGFALLGAAALLSGCLEEPVARKESTGFHALGGAALAEATARGYELLLDGDLAGAERAFRTAAPEPACPLEGMARKARTARDARALFGLSLIAWMEGRSQEALEAAAEAFRHGARAGDPWAELYLDWAWEQAGGCRDPAPLLSATAESAESPEEEPGPTPLLRGLSRRRLAVWALRRGRFEEARAGFDGGLTRWSLVGPFDNRDKTGLSVRYAPEEKLDLAAPMPGRNRPVTWFTPPPAPSSGWVALHDLFDPNTHAVAYGATFVRAPKEQGAVLQVACGGALKVWVNGVEALTVAEYNDFSDERAAVPVRLRAGWNRVLVKSAVEEKPEQWVFGLRLLHPNGGPMMGLEQAGPPDVPGEGQATPVESADGEAMPECDLGLGARLQAALAAAPEDPWLNAWWGFWMQRRRLGDADQHPGEKHLESARTRCPRCPFFQLLLASYGRDSRARKAAEACLAEHPLLPQARSLLAELAWRAGLALKAEEYARTGLSDCGAERGLRMPLVLSKVLRERGQVAEAYRLLVAYLARRPYDLEGWGLILEAEDSRAHLRSELREALERVGGAALIRRRWALELLASGREREAAEFLEQGLEERVFDLRTWVELERAWRQAGDLDRACRTLARAREFAPRNPALLAHLGQAAWRLGKDKETRACFEEALRLKPNFPEVKDLARMLPARDSDEERAFYAAHEFKFHELADPKAEDFPRDLAVVLLHQQVVRLHENGTSSRMVRYVAKLLRPEGQMGLRRRMIFYDAQRQTMEVLRAAVLDSEGREVARARIQDRSFPPADAGSGRFYDDQRMQQVVFEALPPGARIDLQYVIRDRGAGMYGDYFADLHFLGEELPVMLSQYVLDLPRGREVQARTFRLRTAPRVPATAEAGRKVQIWEARNLPGLSPQPNMPPAADQIPFLQVSSMKSWKEVGLWYWNLAQDAFQDDEGPRKTATEVTRGARTDTEKLRAIYDWVVRKVRYLAIELGRGGYKPRPAAETHRALYGDCKDSAVLLAVMLRAAGIECRLALLRNTDQGKLEAEALPAPNLFNHCIAYVPNVDGKDYWLDCATDYHRLGEIPIGDQGAQALVVGPDGGRFLKIPINGAEENRFELRSTVSFGPDGDGKLNERLVLAGEFAAGARQSAETPGQFRRRIEEQLAQRRPGAELLSLELAKPEADGPMWLETAMKLAPAAKRSGDRFSFSFTVPLRLAQNYLTETERRFDLQFRFPWKRSVEATCELDPALKAAVLPEEADLQEEFAGFTRRVLRKGTTVKVSEELVLKTALVPKAQHARFSEFCRKVDALLEQELLLEKE